MNPFAFALLLVLASTTAPVLARASEAPASQDPSFARISVAPYWAHAFVAPTTTRDGAGLTLGYDVSRSFRIALDAISYAPFADSHVTIPVEYGPSEIAWSGALDAFYVPVRVSSESASFEVYLGGGLGLLSSRPLSLVDPKNRSFTYKTKLALDCAAGVRVAVWRSIALSFEIRDGIYNEQLESRAVANGSGPRSADDPSTWYGKSRLTNLVQTRVGLAIGL